jgi:hypothetical protein
LSAGVVAPTYHLPILGQRYGMATPTTHSNRTLQLFWHAALTEVIFAPTNDFSALLDSGDVSIST